MTTNHITTYLFSFFDGLKNLRRLGLHLGRHRHIFSNFREAWSDNLMDLASISSGHSTWFLSLRSKKFRHLNLIYAAFILV